MQQLMLWRKAMVNIMFLLLLLMDRFPEIQIQEDAKGLVYKNKQLLILWLLQDGPWDEMQQFDNNITEPLFDNVQCAICSLGDVSTLKLGKDQVVAETLRESIFLLMKEKAGLKP
ncbi:uncharacterized protein LOC130933302 isoform X4 [Arachis stenosperma]|uniref:uncharacterized protein LOC130933302 isoform X4 n=1 Tax=Arachis stenosperma TaxID=217475 RepID=UPI0025AB7065|nr:uncharacterized protein LOC130933302 isoform X4 [Arachis stenosperma]